MKLPPKVTRQISKTSISSEISSKSHTSNLENEHFVRGFLQKVMRQVSKTTVSYEISSKSHTSSLQNKHFIGDFLQKSYIKSPKLLFRTRLPQKFIYQSLQNEYFARNFLPKSNKNTHSAPTPMPISQRHAPLPYLTTNLSTSIRVTRTKSCAS